MVEETPCIWAYQAALVETVALPVEPVVEGKSPVEGFGVKVRLSQRTGILRLRVRVSVSSVPVPETVEKFTVAERSVPGTAVEVEGVKVRVTVGAAERLAGKPPEMAVEVLAAMVVEPALTVVEATLA